MTILEVLWVGVSALGLWVCGANLIDAYEDWRYAWLGELKDESTLAFGVLRSEVTRALTHGLFLALGIGAIITPATANDVQGLTQALLSVTFFIVQSAMIFDSLSSRKTRKMLLKERLDELIEREKQQSAL